MEPSSIASSEDLSFWPNSSRKGWARASSLTHPHAPFNGLTTGLPSSPTLRPSRPRRSSLQSLPRWPRESSTNRSWQLLERNCCNVIRWVRWSRWRRSMTGHSGVMPGFPELRAWLRTLLAIPSTILRKVDIRASSLGLSAVHPHAAGLDSPPQSGRLPSWGVLPRLLATKPSAQRNISNSIGPQNSGHAAEGLAIRVQGCCLITEAQFANPMVRSTLRGLRLPPSGTGIWRAPCVPENEPLRKP